MHSSLLTKMLCSIILDKNGGSLSIILNRKLANDWHPSKTVLESVPQVKMRITALMVTFALFCGLNFLSVTSSLA